MPSLSIDLETRSRKDIDAGVHAYFGDESTEVLCASYAFFGADAVSRWRPGSPCPGVIVDHVESGGAIFGWNVPFERRAWITRLNTVHGWPLPKLEQFHDTAAWAAAMSLPRNLEDCAIMLRLAQRKDSEGHALMLKMSKPHRKTGEWVWSPEMQARLEQYCDDDVRTEMAVRMKLRRPSESERALWLIDQAVNDRGARIDIPLVLAMAEIVGKATATLTEELRDITAGRVPKASNLPAIKKFLNDNGFAVTTLKKEQLPELIAISAGVTRRVLEIRQEANAASNAKLAAALAAVTADERLHDMFRFHGAHTGRWTGSGPQPQNFPRGTGLVGNQDLALPILMARSLPKIELYYGNPIRAVSDSLRGIFIPSKGKLFAVGDFSQIEARLTAWVAGEQAVLNAFEEGRDLYKLAAGGIYRCAPEDIPKDDPRRQVGKVSILSMGFGGGVNALANMGAQYGIDFADVLPGVWATAPLERQLKTQKKYEEQLKRGNVKLPKEAWMACELIKRAYRDDNPSIVSSWYQVDDAMWQAMAQPGVRFECCRISVIHEKGMLWMRLPSGRDLAWAQPKVAQIEPPWSDKTVPRERRERQNAITVASPTAGKQLSLREPIWPGMGIQAPVQAIARDLLAVGMKAAEAAGYEIVLHSHDEAVAEHSAPDIEEFCSLLCTAPDWAEGLPYQADGWIGDRYEKR